MDFENTFTKVLFDVSTTVSEAVKALGWGHNKLIRNGGVRIADEIKLWKEWEIVKDPNTKIDSCCFIGTKKKIARIVITDIANGIDD